MVEATLAALKAQSASTREITDDGWLRGLSATDVLRYARAAGTSPTRPGGESEVLARLLRTAAWRVEFGVEEIARNQRYSPGCFFGEASAESDWLMDPAGARARDGRGRAGLLFQAARHTPAQYDSGEWLRFIVHNAEAALSADRVSYGP